MTILINEEKSNDLIQDKDFEKIEYYIQNNQISEDCFEEFFYNLVITENADRIEYFFNKYPETASVNGLFVAVYKLCEDNNNIELIKKLTSLEILKSEAADHYCLRALQLSQYEVFDYFINNFKFKDLTQCKRILHGILNNGKTEYLNFLYNNFFKSYKKDTFSYLFEGLLQKLSNNNKECLLSFIHIFELQDYFNENINKLKNVKFSDDFLNILNTCNKIEAF